MTIRNTEPHIAMGSGLIKRLYILGLLFGLMLMNSQEVFAVGSAGFENAALSTSSLARGNAMVANPEDASIMAFNPAGLSKLKANEIYVGNSLIHGAISYEAIEGRNNEDSSETATPVPFFYIATKTSIENLVLGFGANSPFGLSAKYSSTGNFRYTAFFTELKSQSYNVSAGYEINPQLSIGGGVTYMELRLQQNGAFNSPVLAFDANDSPFELDVEGHGMGYNLGLLLTPVPEHTIGVFYRSQVRAKLDGILSTDNLGTNMQATFGTNGATSHLTSADTDYKLPANITIGYKYEPSDRWDMEIDVGWTDWSSFDSFDVTYGESNGILDGFKNFSKDYDDVISMHLGGTYTFDPTWNMSAGYFFYDRAANKNTYTNENPDGNRHALAVGVEYNAPEWSFDVMYMAIFVLDVNIENTTGGTNGGDIDGTYSSFTQLLTTGWSRRF